MEKVLFIVGSHACGKTYSSKKYITTKEDVKMIDTGPIMRKIHKKMEPETLMKDWINSLEIKYGKSITSQIISNEIEKIISNTECSKLILIGFRTFEGIAYTIEHLNIEDFSILYIDAPQELLYKNYLSRETENISFEEFKSYLKEESNSGLAKLKQMALDGEYLDYYYKFSNDDNLEQKIDEYLVDNKPKIRYNHISRKI